MGLKQKLRSSWEDRHRLIRHCEQQKIEFTPRQLKGLHQSSKCFKAGFCWCKATGKRDRRWRADAIQLEQRIIQMMKKRYLVNSKVIFTVSRSHPRNLSHHLLCSYSKSLVLGCIRNIVDSHFLFPDLIPYYSYTATSSYWVSWIQFSQSPIWYTLTFRVWAIYWLYYTYVFDRLKVLPYSCYFLTCGC